MFKTILYSMFAVFLFALGAMGSWYFFNAQEDPEEDATALLEEQDLSANDEPLPGIPAIQDAMDAIDVPLTVEPEEKPLPTVQPTKPLTAEEIYRFGLINRNRTEKLRQRENALDERARQMQLEFKDLEARQAEVDGILEHIKDTISAGEALISQINQRRLEMAELKNKLDAQEADLQSKTGLSPEQQEENDKKVGGLIQSMKPDAAATLLTSLANSGEMDGAIALIEQMEQRNAAKILEAIPDATLQTEFASKLRARKRMQVSAAPNKQR